jgi:cytochrome c-type biogenesis protein CcmH
MRFFKGLLIVLLLLQVPTWAVAKEATPMAMDPELEKKVNEISSELRCLVCQNQTIADSHAELAIDLKNQVRDMVKAGQTQKQINEYMVTRYGDFVLYRPAVKPTTMLLWVGPFLLLLIGLAVLVINLRKRMTLVKNDAELSSEENEKLKTLLESESTEQTGQQQNGEDKS